METLNFANMPCSLMRRPQWVLWKIVERDADKPTKLPYQVGGAMAKSNDPATWGSFKTAAEKFRNGGYAGIGFMFAADDEFCGIDLDGCRDPQTGKVADWAKAIILKFNSYAEVSPSQTGVKIFVRGMAPFDRGRKIEVKDAPTICDKTAAIEVYDKLRYFAVTGWRLAGQPDEPEPRQDVLEWLRDTYFVDDTKPTTPGTAAPEWQSDAAILDRARKYLARMPIAISGSDGSGATFHAACVLVRGFGLAEQDAMALLREWNSGCKPPWSEHELQHKVNDAVKAGGPVNYLRNAKSDNWDKINVPHYEQPAPKPEPKSTTLLDAARSYVETLREGRAELTTLGIGELDYAIGGGVEPGELVILAARPSHGKSAVALQCMHVWTAMGMPCLLISEEMSSLALGKRTIQYVATEPQEHWATNLNHLDVMVEDYAKDRAKAIIAESCGSTEIAIEQIEKHVKESGVRAVIVDYAQILRGVGKTRYDQITNTSILLKQVAAKHKVILLMLCQLSREIEKRTKFTPFMSDIKETGQLEQDADVILFLVWPHRIDSKQPAEDFMFFVAKNRNRAINQAAVKCRFLPARQMILESKVEAPATNWRGSEPEPSMF